VARRLLTVSSGKPPAQRIVDLVEVIDQLGVELEDNPISSANAETVSSNSRETASAE